MCKHLVAACMILKVPLIGLTFKKSLRTVRRRLKAKADDSLLEEPPVDHLEQMERIDENSESVNPIVNDPEPIVAAMPAVVPPRRGRPPKVPKALVPDDEVIEVPKKKHTIEKTRTLRPRLAK
jgi:hypothetical protein